MSDTKNKKTIGIVSAESWRRLEAAGLVPANCKRAILDIGYPGEPATVYWECYADQEALDVFLETVLTIGPAVSK